MLLVKDPTKQTRRKWGRGGQQRHMIDCKMWRCFVYTWSDHALFKLPDTSSCMVRDDPLHILFCKGLYSHLIGSILHFCCYYEGPGTRTANKTNLKLSMITDPGKPWSKHPILQGESRHSLPALTPVPQPAFADTTEICEVEKMAQLPKRWLSKGL